MEAKVPGRKQEGKKEFPLFTFEWVVIFTPHSLDP